MPDHYIYVDPDLSSLRQGDVLIRTEELVALLREIHPRYGNKDDYTHFLVLTQSCDLVRRNGSPSSPYITVAAVRPLEVALRREAAQYQTEWQRATRVVGAKAHSQLHMFVCRLLDNNEQRYFYLHQDVSLGLSGKNCAFLPLAVALRAEHYELCLRAKRAELNESFQAKLGWLVGNLYSRIGTPEWDEHYPDKSGKCGATASQILRATFINFDERKIIEGVSRFVQAGGDLATADPDKILEAVKYAKVQSKRERFRELADRALDSSSLISWVGSALSSSLKGDSSLRDEIGAILEDHLSEVAAENRSAVAETIAASLQKRVATSLQDGVFEKRPDIIKKVVGTLVEDATVVKLLSE